MSTEKKLVKINCILRGETAEKFAKIKESTGLTNNTEVVRLIIHDFYATNLKVISHA